jgi:hypothetical protein
MHRVDLDSLHEALADTVQRPFRRRDPLLVTPWRTPPGAVHDGSVRQLLLLQDPLAYQLRESFLHRWRYSPRFMQPPRGDSGCAVGGTRVLAHVAPDGIGDAHNF